MNKYRSSIKWKLTKITLFCCILQDILFWPTSYYSKHWVISVIPFFLIILNKNKWLIKGIKDLPIYIIIFLLIIDSILLNGIIPSVAISIVYILGLYLFKLKQELKINLLYSITKWFGLIIGICIVFYIFFLTISFPPFNILIEPFGYDDHYNYLFFLINTTQKDSIIRFSGPFIEPGHLGMISAFILYANKFNYKSNKYLWPITFGIILTLSLAGYVLLILGYILCKKINLKYIITFVIIFSAFYYFTTSVWNDGDNPINEKIVERLQYDKEKGISGNNRNLYGTEIYFIKMIADGSILWGIGNSELNELTDLDIIGGAGITIFLITNGIIGLILIFAYYLMYALKASNKDYALKFLILLWLCFLQRAYPYWIAWLLPYVVTLYPKRKTTKRVTE